MKIRGNKVVWLSENENVSITKLCYSKRYFVSRLYIYWNSELYLSIATFEKTK